MNAYIPKPVHPTYQRMLLLATLSIATSILPARSPPLLPLPTIKLLLSQFPINLIMRLTHPSSQTLPAFHPWLISLPAHPLSEIVRAYPAWVELREEGEELLHFGLLSYGSTGRV